MPKQTKDEKALKEERMMALEGAIIMGSMIMALTAGAEESRKRVNALAESVYEKLFPVVEKRKYSKKNKSEKITIEDLPEEKQ